MIIQDEVKNKVNLEEKADEEKEKDKDGNLLSQFMSFSGIFLGLIWG